MLPRLVSAVLLAAVLAACASPAPDAPAPPASPAPAAGGVPGPEGIPEGMGSPQADGVFPRTVTHFGGSTQIPGPPTRIVAIATGQADALVTLGVVPIAAARGDDAGLVPAYLRAAFPQHGAAMDTIADVGLRTEPDLEAIAAARPDLILANSTASKDLYPLLARIAPTVLTEGTGVNWKQDFLLLADALGQEGAAQQTVDGIVADARAAGAKAGQEPVSFVRITQERTRIFGVASFAGFIAWDAGLVRPDSQQFAKTSQDLSAEEIGRADGYWIFWSVQGAATDADAELSPTVSGSLWKGLGAVQAGRAVRVEDDPWFLNAGPTAAKLVVADLDATFTR